MKKVMPLVFRIECNDVEDKYYPKIHSDINTILQYVLDKNEGLIREFMEQRGWTDYQRDNLHDWWGLGSEFCFETGISLTVVLDESAWIVTLA